MTDVGVYEITGSGWNEFLLSGAATDKKGRYCLADEADPANIGTNYPIPVPDSGGGYNSTDYNYSYWKSHLLKFSSWGSTEVQNLRWYTDGALDWGTDVEVLIGMSSNSATVDNGMPSGNYQQASGSGDSGYPIGDAHSFYSPRSTGNAFNFDSASPLWIQSGTVLTDAGYTNAVVTQVSVGTGASSGVKTDETFTWKYDLID